MQGALRGVAHALTERRGPIEWPPRSPDLTPLDFFLWGYLKSIVYGRKPETMTDLKNEITSAIQHLNGQPLIIARSLISFKTRLLKCSELEGAHVEVFK